MVIYKLLEIELTSDITKALALANNLINGVESLIEDCECHNAYISNEFMSLDELIDEEIEIRLSGCNYKPDNLFELKDLIRFKLIRDIRVESGDSGTEYRRLYELVAKLCIEKLVPYMRYVSMKTATTRIEYMYIVLKNGKAELLEGEIDKITIPHVDATIMLHTHSSGCIPSPNDLKTASGLLIDRGLGIGVISPTCYFLILRFGPFTEEDYLVLRNLCRPECEYVLPSRKYISKNLVVLIG